MNDDPALDLFIGLLTLAYGVSTAVAWYVAFRFVPPALKRPHIDVLSGAAIWAAATAVGVAIGALLGVNGMVLLVTHNAVRLIPQLLSLPLLAVALGAPSVGSYYALLQVRRWDREQQEAHEHKRIGDGIVRHHRRATDPPPGEGDGPRP